MPHTKKQPSKPEAPTAQPAPTKPRYVELVRVSGRTQVERDTPEMQRLALDALAKQRPGQRIERIEALAVSAALPLDKTVQGRRLLALAADGFDELRLWDIDRGLGARAEDPRDRLAIFAMVREAGAVLVDCNGRVIDPSLELGELDYYLRTFFAAQERRKIVARTQAGRRRIAAAGGYSGAGSVPYGLSWDRDKRQWHIVPERAAIVREIYKRCLAGESGDSIATVLNARGVPTQKAKRWQPSVVHKMLRHPSHRGELTQEGIMVKVPAVIDDATWYAVQRALDLRPRRRRSRCSKTLCIGRVWCPCGKRAYVRTAKGLEYIRCLTLLDRWRNVLGGKPCEYAVTHRADQIDPIVWQTVSTALTQPETLRAAITGEDQSATHREELARCETLLVQLLERENHITRAFRRNLLSAEAWTRQLEELVAERTVLERTRDVARQHMAASDAIALSMDSVAAQIEELRKRVRSAAPAERKAIIETVIPGEPPFGIVLWPDKTIDVRGALFVPADSEVDKQSLLPARKP